MSNTVAFKSQPAEETTHAQIRSPHAAALYVGLSTAAFQFDTASTLAREGERDYARDAAIIGLQTLCTTLREYGTTEELLAHEGFCASEDPYAEPASEPPPTAFDVPFVRAAAEHCLLSVQACTSIPNALREELCYWLDEIRKGDALAVKYVLGISAIVLRVVDRERR